MLVNLSWMATLKKHLSAICKQGQQLRFPHRTHAGKMAGLGVDWEECYCCRRNSRGSDQMQNKRMGLKREAARNIPQQGKHLVFITLQYFHDLTTFRFVKSRQCNRVLPWKKIIGGSWGQASHLSHRAPEKPRHPRHSRLRRPRRAWARVRKATSDLGLIHP